MPEDLVARALTSLRNRDFVSARNCIAAFAEDNQLELQHYLIRGLSEIALKEWNSASATFKEATRVFPHQPQLWFNLGVVQENLGLVDGAAESFEHCLDLQPENGDACGNLSNIYRRMGLFAEAEHMAHRAYEHGVAKVQALNSLGLALTRQGKLDAAEKIFRQVLGMESANAHALVNLANLSVDRLDFTSAWPLYSAARTVDNDPVIRHDEALARLMAGDYATGWPFYEARLERPASLRIRPIGPLWRGESPAGKTILIVAEQGFGDVIQFCRYGSVIQQQGGLVTWMVPKSLVRLLDGVVPGRVLPETDLMPQTDYWLPILSLPLSTMKLAPSDAPPAPYLRAPDAPKLPGLKKGKRSIGIIWTASPTNERGFEKSMPIEVLAPLWNLKDAQFYAPFINPRLDEITNEPVQRLDNLITDFADTAALLKQLDHIVTVDTATAHLAGALGLKAYVLLAHCPDWRWGFKGETTPFYPSLTLLRQPKPGDWESVISELAGKLA